MDLQRKPFLINRALNKFLTASVFSSVAIQLAVMIDSIIVANFVGPDAMSAISVCMPVMGIIVNIGYLIGMGGTLLISKAIGENNMEHGSHIAAVALILLLSSGLVLMVTGGLFSNWLVSLLCSDASIAGYATTYLRLFFLLDLLPLFLYNAICGFTEADGHPQVVTRAVIIAGIVNIVLDLLFVGVFHWGISGAMYATVINDLVVPIILFRHLYKNSSFRCHMPSKGFLSISREIFAEGIPLTVGDIALMAGFMVLNSAIIYNLGSSSMFIWSVCMEIFDFVMISLNGVETSMVSLGGFLTGDNDITGFRLLVRRILRIVCSVLLLFTLAILIEPQAVAMVFGARGDESIDSLSMALRIFSLCLLPIGVMNVMRVVFQLLGYRFASGALFTSQMFFMDLVIFAFVFFFPSIVWWGFPISSVLMLAMMFAYTLYYHHRDKELSPFTLIPKRSHDSSIDFSVPYQVEALGESLERIRQFVTSNPKMQSRTNDIMLTCEEIMKNIIEHSKGDVLKWSIDVHLRYTDDQISFIIKDAGSAFNPLEHLPQNALDLDNPQFGIRIMSSMCEKLSYKHMWGQNILLGSFHAND
jgi:Na+-driven multidrug efflux pump/anti-sigma regulatory factor (Ser/Thr protein kinase)